MILSTIESKYIGATYTAKEVIWLYFIISQIFKSILLSTNLFLDNKFAIKLTKDHHWDSSYLHHFTHMESLKNIANSLNLKLSASINQIPT